MKWFVLGLGAAAILLWSLLLKKSEPAAPAPELPIASEAEGPASAERVVFRTKAALRQPDAAESLERPKPAKVLQDPDMKEVLEGEARSGALRAAKALLDAGLAQHLQLNETQRALLQELLTQRGAIVWDKIMVPMAAGELDESGMGAAGKAVKEALATNEGQIRRLLGNDGFEVYQWYEKTQPDRDHMQRLNSGFARAGQDLSAEQREQLLALMIRERPAFRWQYDFADPATIDYEHWHDYFTEENFNTYFQELRRFNDHIAQSARDVLTVEQTALLQKLLNQHLQKSKLTVRTTMALMGQRR